MKFQSSESFELPCVNFFIALTVDWTVPAFHKIKSFVLIDSLSENWTVPSFRRIMNKNFKCRLDRTSLS